MLEDRRLSCIPLGDSNQVTQPIWTYAEFKGRLIGTPLVQEKRIVVAESSRRITALNPATGALLWEQRLSTRVGPSTAPVPFGPDQFLAPLSDGTFTVVAIPQPSAEIPEVKP